MTEPETTRDAIQLAKLDDLLDKCHDLAARDYRRAEQLGVHEHIRDQLYLTARVTAMSALQVCDCPDCAGESRPRRTHSFLVLAILGAFMFGLNVYWLTTEPTTSQRVIDTVGLFICGGLAVANSIFWWKSGRR